MKKKIFGFFASGVILMMSLACFAGCKDSGGTIRLWAGPYWGGNNQQFLEEMVEKWNDTAAERGEKEIVLTIQQEMANSIVAGNISGNIGDIILWDRWETVRYAKQSLFLDLDARIAGAGVTNINEYFLPEPMSEFYYEGKYYGIPLDVDVWGFFANRGMYLTWARGITDAAVKEWLINANSTENEAQATVGGENSYYNYPVTWDQFYTAAAGMTQKNGNTITRAGVSAEFEGSFSSWVLTAGGAMLDNAGNATILASDAKIPDGSKSYRDASREVLSFWDKLLGVEDPSTAVTSYAFFTNQGTVDPFLNNRVAFKLNSLLNGVATYNKYKTADFEFDFIPFPKGPSAAAAGINSGTYAGGLIGGYGFTIPRKATNIDGAWSVIEWWLFNTENFKEWSRISKLIPATKDVLEFVKNDAAINAAAPYLKAAISNISSYKVRPPVINYRIYETQIQTPHLRTYLDRSAKGIGSSTEAHFAEAMRVIKENGDSALVMAAN